MQNKTLPFSENKLNEIISNHQTPFHIYDEKAMKDNAKIFLKAFSWNEGFKEYYAVKANPNPFILQILHSLGFGMDCSSLPELLLSEKCGIVGDEIMFSSNDTPREEFKKAREYYTQRYKTFAPCPGIAGIRRLVIAQKKSAILKLRFLCLLSVVPKGRNGNSLALLSL